MKNALSTLKQLDQQLANPSHAEFTVPKGGWIRAIRKSLGLTIKQLAKRLRLSPARIVQIEMSEQPNAATLKSLKAAANAMNCVFVYRLVPKTSLEKTVRQQARKIAEAQITRIAHTMALEGQSVSKSWLAEETDFLTNELLTHSLKNIWNE